MGVERDKERLETILRVIADVERRLGGMDFQAFSTDGDEIDLTAFRLSVIGETPASSLKRSRPAIRPCLGRACMASATL